METRNDILAELSSISLVLARMERVNVFTVPTGYFDSVSDTVFACLHEAGDPVSQLPQGQFADIPVGYFDNLASSVLDRIKSAGMPGEEIRDLSPLLYSIRNKNVFEVPDGYFENLNYGILKKLKSDSAETELKELSPLLYDLREKKVFEVPGEYFSSLAAGILDRINKPAGKVVSMHRPLSFVKYAVAAMMTGVVAFGLYKYIDKPGSVVSHPHSTEVAVLDTSIEQGKTMNEQQFNEKLATLNEADIASYLETTGDISDLALLRNNLDDNNLPSQDDYLLDGKTLENYLKDIEKSTANN